MFFEGGFPFGGMPFHGGGGGGRGGPKRDVDNSKFYTLLGVPKDADENVIKKAYRKLALQHHPDRGGDPEKFKEVTKAYEVLADADKRRAYDQFGEEGIDAGAGGGPDPSDIFASMFGGGGRGGGGARRRPKTDDIGHQLEVDLEQIYSGAVRKMQIKKDVICEPCKGEGASKVITCNTCGGEGAVNQRIQMGPMITQRTIKCPNCSGRGKSFDPKDKCQTCRGNGTTAEKKTLEVTIERGAKDKSKIVFKGEADQKPGCDAGDVIFVIVEKPHKTFKRVGEHLVIPHKVSLLEALTGFSLTVQHLDGRQLLLHSTPGCVYKPGDKLVVKNEGLPIQGRFGSKGHLVVELEVVFPERFNEEVVVKLKECLPGTVSRVNQRPEHEVHYLENSVGLDLSGKASRSRQSYEDEDDEEEGGHSGPQTAQCSAQ